MITLQVWAVIGSFQNWAGEELELLFIFTILL